MIQVICTYNYNNVDFNFQIINISNERSHHKLHERHFFLA